MCSILTTQVTKKSNGSLLWKSFASSCSNAIAKKFPRNSILTLEVEDLDISGKAIGREVETKAIFVVGGALPGQVINARVLGYNKKSGIGQVATKEVLEESKFSKIPECKYYQYCGGCKLQDLNYEQQLLQKDKQMLKLFNSICQVFPCIGVDKNELLHYRNKMVMSASTKRWLTKEDEDLQINYGNEKNYDFTIGLFPKNYSNRSWDGKVVSIEECLLQDPIANKLLETCYHTAQKLGIPAYDGKKRIGFLKNVMIRVGSGLNGKKELLLSIYTSEENSQLLETYTEKILNELDPEVSHSLVAIQHCIDDESIRHLAKRGVFGVVNNSLIYLNDRYSDRRKPFIYDNIGKFKFQVSASSFFQPNSTQAKYLYDEIARVCRNFSRQPSESSRLPVVWDLFCGIGSIGIYVSDSCKEVIGLEVNDEAVRDAKFNSQLNNIPADSINFHCVDLQKDFEILKNISNPDIVIVDPPRSGLHPSLIKLLIEVSPQQICYVSCNPQSQLRDINLLSSDYVAKYIQPVDMLPHTPHLETICLLEKLSVSY